MKQVLFGLLGARLDYANSDERWRMWRPTVAICQHEDFLIDRFELLHEPKLAEMAELTADDIRCVSPETDVRLHSLDFADPWDFEEVYEKLHGYFGQYSFKPDD